MTKFRAPFASLAGAAIIALASSAPAFAFPGGSQGELSIDVDPSGKLALPAPPKLATPKVNPGPPESKTFATAPTPPAQGSAPQSSTFKFRTTPLWGVRYGR
jgi:hypothetical protein